VGVCSGTSASRKRIDVGGISCGLAAKQRKQETHREEAAKEAGITVKEPRACHVWADKRRQKAALLSLQRS
jgi:hypothetical protein